MTSTRNAPSQSRYSPTELTEAFGDQLEFDVPLAQFTSFRTGGPAAYFLHARTPQAVAEAIKTARRLRLEFFLLGGGSNLLVADSGYDGLVIKVDVGGLAVLEDNMIECGAGEDLMALVNFACDNGLTGLEFAAGIWGSVGGAIYGNAGAFGGEIGERIVSLNLVDRDGNMRTVTPDYLQFGYRDSYLKKTREVIVNARLQLQPGDSKTIRARIDEILALRVTKHPDQLTAGCFFKNIPDPNEPYGKLPAGRLLEQVGAKGMSVGGAKVFEKHANIIVNTGTATSADICRLADRMKDMVHRQFGIELQEEVQKIGNF